MVATVFDDGTGAGGTGVGDASQLRRRQLQRHDCLGHSDDIIRRLRLPRGGADGDADSDAHQRRHENAYADPDPAMFADGDQHCDLRPK